MYFSECLALFFLDPSVVSSIMHKVFPLEEQRVEGALDTQAQMENIVTQYE
jgi:hypothetical protein